MGVEVAQQGIDNLRVSTPFVLSMLKDIEEIALEATKEKYKYSQPISCGLDGSLIHEIIYESGIETKKIYVLNLTEENITVLQIFCAWQEKGPLNQTGSDRMQCIPLMLYVFRWPIEVCYCEQKTFWSLCSYMVRSRKGIEMLVNLINISYCAMKLLPYQDEAFSKYRMESVQEFRFALSEQIRPLVFRAIFVEKSKQV